MLPGLFRTLVGLVVAWFVFRFLDRVFGAVSYTHLTLPTSNGV